VKGAVELRGAVKRYGAERVVDGIDLSIAAGEFFSLLGPSGSGKTTTLMMLAGFASIDEGQLLVDGVDVTKAPPQRRGFGVVFQNYAIFPHLNVFENVAFPLRARRVADTKVRERVTWALDLVQLGGFAERFSRQLSGGQQQRVAIARAIVFEPSIVLMDEPLGALDKNLRYDMQMEIKDIQRRLGMTVIYVTHDQEEAMNLSDRLAILNRGRIEQLGPPREVYERPANRFAGQFLGEANLIPGTVTRAAGNEATLRTATGIEFRALNAQTAAAGTEAALFARPEKLKLAASGPNDNGVQGRVYRRAFLGGMMRCVVEIAPDLRLAVDIPNASGTRVPEIDEHVTVAWPVGDSLILPD
jgi:spermidine/putrescine ABC transporter ATP-binding subunit